MRFILFAIMALALAGCGTPNIGVPMTDGGGAAGKGGNADGSASGVDTNLLVVQPGGTGTQVPIRNEDRVQNSLAAPAFVLDVSGMGSLQTDPLVKSLVAEIAVLLPIATSGGDEATAARASLTEARTALATRLKALADSAEASNLPALTHLSLSVNYNQIGGAPVEKLGAEQTNSLTEGLSNALGKVIADE